MPKENTPAPFELPSDLTSLTPEDLADLTQRARDEATAIFSEEGGPRAENLKRAKELADAVDALTAEDTRRVEESAAMKAQFDEIAARLNPKPAEGEGDGTEVIEGEVVEPAAPAQAAPTPQPVAASARPTGGAITAPRELGGNGPLSRINPSMTAARNQQPAAVKDAPRPALAITASAGLPSGEIRAGQQIESIAALGDLMEYTARSLPVTAAYSGKPGQPYGGSVVARIRHDYPDLLSEDSSIGAVEAYVNKLRANLRPGQMESLVAAGGWCAPSENRYDFFNIACAGGMIDLPTFGVQRGGIRWPISPSLADAFVQTAGTQGLAPFVGVTPSNTSQPWIWTETNDAVSATGTLLKPCIRVPCSTMDEARLECYGVCVTAGNLADNAWPESTRNFLRLLDVAHQHMMNYRYITTIQNLATDLGTLACTGVGAVSPLLDAIELDAVNYRKRYAMCRDDVIEVILPDFVVGPLRADVSRRTGVDMLGVTDEMILAWFNVRHVRVQLVDDYQVRGAGQPGATGTPITSWPSSVEYMLYAPGTVALGNGMNLDLGVVRDSVLNSTNDFTAAWYEQCHLIAQFGHAVWRHTVPLCPSGVTGAANITACCA